MNNERLLSGAGTVAGVTAGSSVAFILIAVTFSILIYEWHKRKHSRVIQTRQRTMRKLSADLERNDGKIQRYNLQRRSKILASPHE